MSTSDWHAIAAWLKSTILGIILLGAIGSILAVAILKASSWVGKRLFTAAFDRFMLFNFRPFSFAALLTYRYAGEGRWADLVIYAVSVLTSAAAELVLFAIGVLATVIVAI